MTRIEKTVFISYRRANKPWALFIYQNLTNHGYDVFIDFQNINSGNFEAAILDNIRARAHFVVILTPSALENCENPNDWLRREIEAAMDEKRNIVPLMVEGFDFGSPLIKNALTGKLATLSQINGLRIPDDYPFEAMDRLRERYLNIALSDVVLPTLPKKAQEITIAEKLAANEATLVREEELTAQKWFERGYVLAKSNNFEEAIKSFTKAIQIDPANPYSYLNRGSAKGNNNELDEAIADIDKAIHLKSGFAEAFYYRGLAYGKKTEFTKAIEDFTTAIDLKADYSNAYYSRGLTYSKVDEYDKAISDLTEAVRLEPNYVDAFYTLAVAYSSKSEHSKAITSFTEAIRLKPEKVETYYGLGVSHLHSGNYDEAIARFTQAIQLKVDFADAYWGRGRANIAKKEYDLAVEDFQRYFDLGGREAIVHELLNDAQMNLGE
jgi:tetratricopeptide (TPR) repeat protein